MPVRLCPIHCLAYWRQAIDSGGPSGVWNRFASVRQTEQAEYLGADPEAVHQSTHSDFVNYPSPHFGYFDGRVTSLATWCGFGSVDDGYFICSASLFSVFVQQLNKAKERLITK